MAAQGTFTLFNDFALQLGEKIHQFPSGGENYKMALITNAKVAAATDADASLTDYTECSGGTYVAQALANQDFTLSGDTATMVCDDITFAKDAASGPTDCYQALVYLDDGPGYNGVGFVELTLDAGTTPLSLQDAAIVLSIGAGTSKLFEVEANAA
jgi:hypothetical protein